MLSERFENDLQTIRRGLCGERGRGAAPLCLTAKLQ